VAVETEDKVDESRSGASGTLILKAGGEGGPALLVEIREGRPGARPVRTLVREGVKDFHPFEIWRRGAGRWLRDRFEVALAAVPGGGDLPEAVTGPDGSALEVRRARPQGRRRPYDRAAPEAPAAGPDPIVLDLVPKDEALRKRWIGLRVRLDPDSFLVVGLELDSALRRVSCSLSDVREVRDLDETVFEADRR